MGVSAEWFDKEQTIIYQVISEPFTWDEFHAQDKVIKTMIASVTHPVYMLVNIEAFSMRNAPGGVLTHIRMTMPSFPNNLRQIVIIAPQLFARSLIKMVQRLGFTGPNLQIQAVESMDEAQALLDTIRSE